MTRLSAIRDCVVCQACLPRAKPASTCGCRWQLQALYAPRRPIDCRVRHRGRHQCHARRDQVRVGESHCRGTRARGDWVQHVLNAGDTQPCQVGGGRCKGITHRAQRFGVTRRRIQQVLAQFVQERSRGVAGAKVCATSEEVLDVTPPHFIGGHACPVFVWTCSSQWRQYELAYCERKAGPESQERCADRRHRIRYTAAFGASRYGGRAACDCKTAATGFKYPGGGFVLVVRLPLRVVVGQVGAAHVSLARLRVACANRARAYGVFEEPRQLVRLG